MMVTLMVIFNVFYCVYAFKLKNSPILARKAVFGSLEINKVLYNKPHDRLIYGMKMRKLPRTDIVVSQMCVGTNNFGEKVDEQNAFDQMNLAVDNYGVNFIETSEVYPIPYHSRTIGASNKIVGNWLKKRGSSRKDIIVNANICGYSDMCDWTLRKQQDPSIDLKYTDLSRRQIIAAVDIQLKQLQVDYIDILTFQWPERIVNLISDRNYDYTDERTEREMTPMIEQLETIQELIKSGKIRAFGLANETPYGLTRFVTMAQLMNLPIPCMTTQPLNLLNRIEMERGMQEAISSLELAFIAGSPLGGGALSGKYLKSHTHNLESRLIKYLGYQYRYICDEAKEATEKLFDACSEHDMPLAPIALAWVSNQPYVTSVILSASNPTQMEENIWSSNAWPVVPEIEEAFEKIFLEHLDPLRGPYDVIDPTLEHYDPMTSSKKLRKMKEIRHLLDQEVIDELQANPWDFEG